MKKIILYFIFLISLIGCQQASKYEENSIILKNKQRHIYQTGFKSELRSYKFNNQEYIAYDDFVTYKKIVLHGVNSNDKIEIPVNEVLKRDNKILTYDIINLDSILIMSGYTNHLYLINQLGEIKKMIDFNPILEKFYNSNYSLELTGFKEHFLFNDTTLICALTPFLEVENFEWEIYYEQIYNDSLPYFIKIDNIFKDSLIYKFGLYDFYQNFSEKSEFTGELNTWSFANDNIIVVSLFSDTLYLVDKDLLTINKKVPIQSNFIEQPIFIPPLTLKDMAIGVNHNKHNASYPTIRSSVFFDGNYYIFGLHSPDGINTVMFMDTNNQIVDEILLDSNEFDYFYGISKNNQLYFNDDKLYKDSTNYYKINTYTSYDYIQK